MLKKRTLLILFLLGSCVAGQLFLRSAFCHAGEDTLSTEKSKSESELSTWNDWKLDNGSSQTQSKLVRKFALAIGFVAILGGCAWYVSKKFGSKLTITRGKEISIVETIHLGSHRTLYLLEVGGRQKLLIGSTNENINILADVTEAVSSRLNEEVM